MRLHGGEKTSKINAKYFRRNPKVPEIAAVTGVDVAKKSRYSVLFFVS
jgi:hypothetical protein